MRPEELYLVDILEACDAITRFINGRTRSEFLSDDYFQSAVLAKFGIIGVSVGRLSDELRHRYSDVPWQQARSFRNLIVHAYFAIDWEIVWSAAVEDVPVLRAWVTSILDAEYPDGQRS